MIDIQLSELDLSLEVADIDDLDVILDEKSTVGIQGPILFGPNPTALDYGQLDLDLLGFPYQGNSAYQIAVSEGFTGTAAEWLASLVGPESPNAAVAQAASAAAALSATSAQNHANAAELSKTQAATSATQAAASATAAANSSAQSLVHRTAAENIATAVALLEQQTEAHVTDAEQFAAASQVSRVAAETARSAAEASETSAATSATSATASAASATNSATLAVNAQTAAGNSAAAALLSESAASSYADDSLSSANASQISQIAATASREEAEIAASAAVLHRDSAEAFADDAGSSASAASTSATNAATSAGNASTSETNASTSATTAAGHAATASTQATLAANSATAAGGSATAANTSAGQASTSATNAGNSATAANTSAVSAASSYAGVVQITRNSNFDQGVDGWTAANVMTPEASNSGRTNILKSASVGQNGSLLSQLIPITVGANYRASVGYRMLSGTGSAVFYIGAFFYDSAGALLTASDGTGNYFLGAATFHNVAAGWQDRSVLIGPGTPYVYGTPTFPAGTVAIRFVFYFNYSGIADAVCGIDYFTLETATAEVGALASASAAATSASSAATSATSAGTSATAASTSATNASTSAGNAGTSATNAANSATTATTQANNASTSASTAATHATNAGNSASAAGTSATTAGTHATNAGNSATAANTSAVNAASSYTNTVVSGGNQDFSDGLVGWSWNPDRTIPASNYSTGWLSYQPSFQGRPNVIQQTTGNYCFVYSNKLWPVQAGRTYRVRSSVWIGAVAPSLTYIGMRALDSSGAAVTGNGGHIYNVAGGVLLAANQWHDLVSASFTVASVSTDLRNIQLLAFLNYGVTASASSALDGIWLEDITESVTAGNSATAAAGSASSAATSATNAGNSATAANSSAVAAASSFTNANNAATNAANSATAAGTSATTAGTHATNAGNSATAASASAVSAASSFTNTVLVDGNQDFDNGFTGWYTTSGTTPVATASLGGRTNVVSLAAGQASYWRSVKRFPVDTTRKYKVSTEVYAGAGSGSTQFYVGFAAFDANGTALVHSPGSYAYAAIIGDAWPANTGWVKRDSLLNGANAPITGEGTGTWSIFPVGTRSIELLVLQNYNNGPCVSAVNYVYWEDITETQAALSSATAAATSASSASTSAGAAGVSATSAATQATNAGVSAGNAASSASTAATQASNASASAASASSSAVTAANLSGSTANILRRSQFFTGNAVSDFAPWISGNNTLGATAGVYNYSTSWAPDGEFCLFTEAPNSPGSIHDWYSEITAAEALKYYCLSAYAGIFNASSAGDVRVFIEFMNAAGTVLGYTGAPASAFCHSSDGKQGGTSLDNFKRIFVIGQAPATTAKMRAYIRRTNMGTTSYTWVLRPMLSEASATMTAPPPFGPSNIASSVAVTQTAVASLNAQNNLARYEVVADTGGGTARLRLVSSVYGTSVKLDADKIFFGDNTVFDNAVDVLVTTTGSNSRIIAWGAAFGTDGQLTEWEGPSSITWGNHSRANAYFYRANVAPYVGGSALASSYDVTSSNLSRVGTRVGAGSVTTGTVTLTPSGQTGSVTYAWTRTYGDSSITATASTSATTAFTGSVANGQEKQAMFAWSATDGAGKVVTGTVGVALISNA